MISRAYDQRRETARFARRNLSLLLVFPPRRDPKRKGAKSTADSRLARRTSREVGDSEMAPQAVGIAQNRLYETFCTNLRRESIFYVEADRAQLMGAA
jgi:hypothetical protein